MRRKRPHWNRIPHSTATMSNWPPPFYEAWSDQEGEGQFDEETEQQSQLRHKELLKNLLASNSSGHLEEGE